MLRLLFDIGGWTGEGETPAGALLADSTAPNEREDEEFPSPIQRLLERHMAEFKLKLVHNSDPDGVVRGRVLHELLPEFEGGELRLSDGPLIARLLEPRVDACLLEIENEISDIEHEISEPRAQFPRLLRVLGLGTADLCVRGYFCPGHEGWILRDPETLEKCKGCGIPRCPVCDGTCSACGTVF